MIKSGKMQILFFCLIPVGITALFFSIKILRKAFFGDIILEIPFSQKHSEFVIQEDGNYSIWHKGRYFRKAPLDEYKPEITDLSTGEKVRLYSFLLRPNTNNGKIARMELFRFSAHSGKYALVLAEGSSISAVEKNFIRIIPARKVDYDEYFIQVRKTQPVFLILSGIALILLAGLLIIGGFVLGILADQIFEN